MSSSNGKIVHPFAKKDPKPTRARLVGQLDPLGRKRYSEVERFLATVQGATSGLHYFANDWGWAVRYMLGVKNALCTLHLLPNNFEASVPLGKELETMTKTAPSLDSDLKRKLARSKNVGGVKCVRLPIRNDHDYSSFKALIALKAESLKSKKPAKAEKAEKEEAPVAAPAKAAAKPAAKSPAKKAASRKA